MVHTIMVVDDEPKQSAQLKKVIREKNRVSLHYDTRWSYGHRLFYAAY